MNIVVRYVKQRTDGDERFRQKVLTFNPKDHWGIYIEAAMFHRGEGERIISITEAGYH